ncbi:MAG: hypothetical protein LBS91_05900 [Clostridiales Family XIII bacterium]|jgi:hexokinase|nr:hypothetical protein [Clostridiales Family XIII bacterium]
MDDAEKFLKTHGLHEARCDFDGQVSRFTAEMEAGLAGEKSSLLMLPTYLDAVAGAEAKGDVIAVDAGGTNLRIALVSFGGGAPQIGRYEKYRIPGSEGAVGKDEFFARIAAHIGDRTDKSGKVGFCFSFPSEIGANRDGRILGFNKEVKVNGAEGAFIGAELNAALAREGKPPVDVTALNDSAAALIGTLFASGAESRGRYSGYIGLIYGTGINICYHEKSKGMLINTEAGGYDGFEQSACDHEIDAESGNPGDHCFEKMVSGAYFAKVALKAIKLAAREGLFSARACEKLAAPFELDAVSIDRFLESGGVRGAGLGALCDSEADAALLLGIFDGLYERAAKLLAVAMTAVLRKSGADGQRPALIVAEGSTFRKGYLFRERFERAILAHTDGAAPYTLVLADDHAVIGAAASVFL